MCIRDSDYTNRYNLYGTFPGESKKTLLFNGHIDHMPAENEEHWTIPPLKPQVIENRITGSVSYTHLDVYKRQGQ